jgi:sugar phosphate isomerase/epimerase
VQIADNLPLTRMAEAELVRLETHLRTLNLDVELGARGIQGGHLERHLELCHRFGATLLRVVVDGPDHHPSPAEVMQTLEDALPLFEAAGVTLAIENHDRFSARTLADMVTALESPYVGVCLDTVNSFGALEGPGVVTQTLGPFVVNVHVKDFVVRRADHNMGFAITGTLWDRECWTCRDFSAA